MLAPLALAAVAMQACTSTSSPTITLSTFANIGPDQWTTSMAYSIHDCGVGGGLGFEGMPSHGWDSAGDTPQVAAGYTNENLASGCHNDAVFHGAVHFDLSSVGSTDVFQAFLHFTRRSSAVGLDVVGTAPGFTSNATSCAGRIEVATAPWLSPPGAFTHYDYGGPPPPSRIAVALFLSLPSGDLSGRHDDLARPDATPDDVAVSHDATTQVTSFTADVTSQVRDWLSGGSENDGFVLTSVQEDLDAGDNNTCISLFDSFDLELFKVGTPSPIFPTETFTPSTAPTTTPHPIIKPTPTPTPRPTATPVKAAKLVITPTATNAFCLNGQFPSITLKNSGDAALTWSVSADHQVNISPTHGTLNPGQTVQVSVSGSVAAQTVTLSFTSNGGNGQTVYTCK
jgi:hypothetical protein